MRQEQNQKCIVPAAALMLLAVWLAPRAAAEVRLSSAQAVQAAVKKPNPEYSPLARQMRIEGDVEVEVTINDQGDVEAVKVSKGNSMLTPNVVNAVKKWKFTPFQEHGRVQPAVAPLRFSFRL